jgi:hypothetical protein
MSVEFQPGGHSILQDQGRAKIVCETGFALGQSIPPIAYPVFPKLFPVTSRALRRSRQARQAVRRTKTSGSHRLERKLAGVGFAPDSFSYANLSGDVH